MLTRKSLCAAFIVRKWPHLKRRGREHQPTQTSFRVVASDNGSSQSRQLQIAQLLAGEAAIAVPLADSACSGGRSLGRGAGPSVQSMRSSKSGEGGLSGLRAWASRRRDHMQRPGVKTIDDSRKRKSETKPPDQNCSPRLPRARGCNTHSRRAPSRETRGASHARRPAVVSPHG